MDDSTKQYKPRYDLAGQRFGRLTVRGLAPFEEGKPVRWACECSCGNEALVYVPTANLRSGNTKSCGCLQPERIGQLRRTHGHTSGDNRYAWTAEYKAWTAMCYRCRAKPGTKAYKDYAGRGITVCDRWDRRKGGSFENFLEDVGPRPDGKMAGGRSKYSLDRLDNDGNYEPGNVQWRTTDEQMKNRRRQVSIKIVEEAASNLFAPDQVGDLLDAIAALRIVNDD